MCFNKAIFSIALIYFALPLAACAEQHAKISETQSKSVELSFNQESAEQISVLLKGVDVPKQIDTRNPDMPNARSTIITPTYYVGKHDLNADGEDEVFLYRAGSDMCGTAGCHLDIYQQKDNSFHNILGENGKGIISPQKVDISPDKTNGYSDIIIHVTHQHPDIHIWKYNGSHYVSQ